MKTVTVPAWQYQTTIAQWAGRGLHVTANGPDWTVLERPPRPARSGWRAVKLSVLTLGIYPLLVALWWFMLAWWVKPIMAAKRVDRVTVRAV